MRKTKNLITTQLQGVRGGPTKKSCFMWVIVHEPSFEDRRAQAGGGGGGWYLGMGNNLR